MQWSMNPNPKQDKVFFFNDLKYLQFTIEVYGKIGILKCTMHNLA